MKRRNFFALFLAVALAFTVLLPASASAPGDKVADMAGLFTPQERQHLTELLTAFEEAYQLDIAVVTTDDANGQITRDYADDFYDYNGYGYGPDDDGLLFLIDMDNRIPHITTHALAISYFNDASLDRILDDCYDYLVEGDYYGAARAFISGAERVVSREYDRINAPTILGIPTYRWASIFRTALLFAVVATLIVMAVLIGIHKKSLAPPPSAGHAYLTGGMNLIKKRDQFMTTRTTRTAIPRDDGGGGGGGGGRTSTHTSSSGRTHGGSSGRRF